MSHPEAWKASADARRTHGMAGSRVYAVWKTMRARCKNPKNSNYPNYGGRGIKVCARWDASFKNFIDDMGLPPAAAQLDRRDNEGDYEPGNCRWATRPEQAANKRNNRIIEWRGERRILAEWGRVLDIDAETIDMRLRRGWSVDRALGTPHIHGTRTPPPIHYGEKHPMATLNAEQVAFIKTHKFKYGEQSALAREYGVWVKTISAIRRGKSRING